MDLQLAQTLLDKYKKEGINLLSAAAHLSEERKEELLQDIELKYAHSLRAVEVAKTLLDLFFQEAPYSLRADIKQLILSGVLLHDVGDFYAHTTQEAYGHARLSSLKIRHDKDVHLDYNQMHLLTTMIEQHSPLHPEFTGLGLVDFSIRLLRDADFLEDASYLIEDIYAPSRAAYFSGGFRHGPLNPENIKAFQNNEFVHYRNLHTLGDCILLYGAKKATLSLDVSKKLWNESGMEQRFLDAAYDSERRGKQVQQRLRPLI